MKILITGSYCAGKSTLSKQLSNSLNNVIVVEEIPREILKIFGKVNWNLPEIRNYLFIKQLIEERKAVLSNKEFVIIDSGIVGNLAHDKALLPQEVNRKKLLSTFLFGAYDIVFYCEHDEISIYDDGQRYTDESLRDEIASYVLDSLKDLEILDYITLKGTKSKRLSIALEYIKQKTASNK